MLTFFLDRQLDISLYEQLYQKIKLAIENGDLVQNEKLPSKRKLASHLKISQTTVESAYSQLLVEGYLKSKPKVGYFVAANLDLLYKMNSPKQTKLAVKRKEDYLIDFKTNQVDAVNFPYDRFARIEREVVLDKLKNNLNRGDSFGVYEFRERIAEILYAYRGINAKAEQIVVGSGSEHLILLLVLLLGRDKIYAVEEPSYLKNYQLYQIYGVNVKAIGLDDEGILIEDLKKEKANIVHTTPSHQFPKGIVTTITRRLELLHWANESDTRYIIEDDYDSEFRFSGNPIPAMKGMDKADKVIYMNSFSKTLAPSFRISFMVLPEKLVNKYQKELAFFSSSVPTVNQLILERFIKSNEYERHLNRMKNNYKTKRDYLISLLEKSDFKDKIKIYGEEAGLHFLVNIQTEKSEDYLVEKAKDEGIRVYGLSEYTINRCNLSFEKTIVFGYSNLSLEMLNQGVLLLEKAWKNI
ncbi:MAG: PLP-dependent aminotransferase family protein [Candidatus Izemoplasmatales bacterium]|nr:PLP-dependent aminotransferase family protein [Candidatus Izemoplasmatales bacterium]